MVLRGSSRCCDDSTEPQPLRYVRTSQTLDLRHSGVSEVRQDQRLQRREGYRVVGLLRVLRPRVRWRRGSGVVASALWEVVKLCLISSYCVTIRFPFESNTYTHFS
ncbi:hypothetical protein NDU88_003289 [Pleurodeles waltl]|uniref:Uncharacterized protein n=1 Tax=Pleurodeles waltl TaxID=8319 RepID=A0AAV7RI35_PLEWA|nr:hypothetical protein NDU88_003289 [Pleurodeles waltl]